MTIAEEKGDFSRRLKEAMRKTRLDAGPTRFAREFNLRHHGEPVTAQTARKWLHGGALPTQDKLRTLAQWLEGSPHWLRYGGPQRAHTTPKQGTPAYAGESARVGKKIEPVSGPHPKEGP